MPVARRQLKQLGRVGCPARDDHDLAEEPLRLAVVLDHDLRDRGAGLVGLEPDRLRVPQQGDVGVLDSRPHGKYLGVGLGVHETGEAVAVRAAHATAVGHIGLVEHDPAGGVERTVAGGGEVVGELLDPRLVGDRGNRIGRAGRRLRGSSPRAPWTW
jgi:hypothetical protein